METQLTARAPAKLIISGEHSVLYGQPAIAMAVNRYTETTATWTKKSSVHFKLLNLAYAKTHTLKALKKIRYKLQEDYANFLHGKCGIRDVLKRPFELLQYSVSSLLEHINTTLPRGLEIQVNSTIPIGCGMGSSAAAVVSTLHALSHFLQLDWDLSNFISFGRELENLQHGKSSGLDLHLATFGGCVCFQAGKASCIEHINMPMYIVNTGKPQATTGECVNFVAPKFATGQLASNFGMVTKKIDAAIQSGNIIDFQAAIQNNHQLLSSIGVVPKKVANFIKDIEMNGGAAKVCGAGSISGDNGGIVMVVTQHDVNCIVAKYGYKLEQIEVDNYGTKVV